LGDWRGLWGSNRGRQPVWVTFPEDGDELFSELRKAPVTGSGHKNGVDSVFEANREVRIVVIVKDFG
jgi:hypothetical protein